MLSNEANQMLIKIREWFSPEDEKRLQSEPCWIDFRVEELKICKELEQYGFLEKVPNKLRHHQLSFSALVKKLR